MATEDFEILSTNTVVALWQNGELSVVREDLLPLIRNVLNKLNMKVQLITPFYFTYQNLKNKEKQWN